MKLLPLVWQWRQEAQREEQRGVVKNLLHHKGHDLPLGTLRSIVSGADIPEFEWKS